MTMVMQRNREMNDEIGRTSAVWNVAARVRRATAAVTLAVRPWTASLILCAICVAGQPSAVTAQPAIETVAWLQGCWEAPSGRSIVEEQWMAPRGSTMLMMGRTVRDGKLVEYEVVLLREESATLVYEAHPSGQSPASFRSTRVSESSVIFENPEHDFPRTIGYQLNRPDSLLAFVEGPSGGQTRRIEFQYRRVNCPGASR